MSDSLRPTEMAVMALLEQVIIEAEHAQELVQDDGRVTDENDRRQIKDHLMKIRAAVMEVEKALGSKVLSAPPPKPGQGKTLTNMGVHGLKRR